MDLQPVYERIDSQIDQTIREIQEYVRRPSVSVDGSGMRECAELVADRYRRLGCAEVEIVETETFPGVWAYYDAGAPLTLVSYNMYDVRSVGDRSAWTHDPFGAEIEPRGEYPAVLYGRGALVPKGPDTAWLAALRAIREVTGTLPVNVAFLAEGDEILGSQSYAGLIERYRDRLAGIDGLVYFRAAQDGRGELPLMLGYKTFITFELRASGRRWGRGPVQQAAHSATRSIVDSPALRLVQALGTLYREDGEIAVDGWPERLLPVAVPEVDRELMDRLLARLAGKPWIAAIPGLAGTGVSTFAGGAEGADVLTRYVYGSSLNIQGIYSGYTGPGSRTYTIPEEAVGRLDARLVTDAAPSALVEALGKHLESRGFGDLEVRVLSAYPGSRTAYDSPLVLSFAEAAERAGGDLVAWPMQGYGGPWSIFARDFGAALVFATGVGRGEGVGLPDEYIVLDGGGKAPGLPEMERFYVDFLVTFATRGGDRSVPIAE
jgi:acetylornithine deacetylase/succinyl-diaminopimelate desuccinylase-like protein